MIRGSSEPVAWTSEPVLRLGRWLRGEYLFFHSNMVPKIPRRSRPIGVIPYSTLRGSVSVTLRATIPSAASRFSRLDRVAVLTSPATLSSLKPRGLRG